MNLQTNYNLQLSNSLHQIIPSSTSVINNITKLALPIFGIIGVSYIPVASAGTLEYLACVADCYAMERPPGSEIWGLAGCIASCAFYKMS